MISSDHRVRRSSNMPPSTASSTCSTIKINTAVPVSRCHLTSEPSPTLVTIHGILATSNSCRHTRTDATSPASWPPTAATSPGSGSGRAGSPTHQQTTASTVAKSTTQARAVDPER